MTNPYSAPLSGQAVSTELDETVVDILRGTGPWLRFLSIIGFLGTGFMALIALVVVGMGMAGVGKESFPVWFGAIYLVIGAVYVYPSVLLWRGASACARAVAGEGDVALIDYLRRGRSLWKFLGISTIAMVGLYGLAVVGVMAYGFLQPR